MPQEPPGRVDHHISGIFPFKKRHAYMYTQSQIREKLQKQQNALRFEDPTENTNFDMLRLKITLQNQKITRDLLKTNTP